MCCLCLKSPTFAPRYQYRFVTVRRHGIAECHPGNVRMTPPNRKAEAVRRPFCHRFSCQRPSFITQKTTFGIAKHGLLARFQPLKRLPKSIFAATNTAFTACKYRQKDVKTALKDAHISVYPHNIQAINVLQLHTIFAVIYNHDAIILRRGHSQC